MLAVLLLGNTVEFLRGGHPVPKGWMGIVGTRGRRFGFVIQICLDLSGDSWRSGEQRKAYSNRRQTSHTKYR